MRFTCAMCKKQPVPFDMTRSFHRFPDKADIRQKLMDVIGVTSVKKTWAVCSDHFATTSFHEQTGYNDSKRRLSPNAVPNKISRLLSDITNVNFGDGKKKEREESETHYMQCESACPNGVNSIKRKCDMDDCASTAASAVGDTLKCNSSLQRMKRDTMIPTSFDNASKTFSSLEIHEAESFSSSGPVNVQSVKKSSAIGEIQPASIEKRNFSKTHSRYN